MTSVLGFVGLGRMGGPMAGRLVAAEHQSIGVGHACPEADLTHIQQYCENLSGA